jgi:hypothetical protein
LVHGLKVALAESGDHIYIYHPVIGWIYVPASNSLAIQIMDLASLVQSIPAVEQIDINDRKVNPTLIAQCGKALQRRRPEVGG